MRKLFSVLTAFLLTAALCMQALAVQTVSPWAQDYINRAASLAILPDCLKSCDMTQPISREEFCELSYETMGYMNLYLQSGGEPAAGAARIYPPAVTSSYPFYDTDNPKVYAMCEISIFYGDGIRSFSPNNSLIREDACMVLERIMDHYQLNKIDVYQRFDDSNEMSKWAFPSICVAYGSGLMNGIGNNLFAPRGTFTREQAVVTMLRLIDYMKTA